MKLFKKQIIEAHRGAKGLVKYENTIDAFQKAIEVGSDAIELDVRKTKDNVIVIRHDADYKATPISTVTKQELDNLTKEEGLYIPTLEEALQFCKGKIFLDIEVKEVGYEKEIVDTILKYLSYNEFYIRSFHIKALRAVKKADKKVITVLLLGRKSKKHPILMLLSEVFPLFKILYSKCKIVSPHYKILKLGYVLRMHLIGRPVLVWTVNDKKLMEQLLLKQKVDGVISDYPDVALEVLNNK